jgi:hypothetical protein
MLASFAQQTGGAMERGPADPRTTPRIRQSEAVDAFLERLEHPCRQEVYAVRQIILGVDGRIGEALKWNAPSFLTTEHFATFNLRARDGVQLVLHRGARPRPAPERLPIPDAAGLLSWRANDRAVAVFRGLDDVAAKR